MGKLCSEKFLGFWALYNENKTMTVWVPVPNLFSFRGMLCIKLKPQPCG